MEINPLFSKEELHKIWEEVKENLRRLRPCPRHHFKAQRDEIKLGKKEVCVNCKGEMSLTDIGVYIRGYEAHGGSADDIWPNYYTGGYNH